MQTASTTLLHFHWCAALATRALWILQRVLLHALWAFIAFKFLSRRYGEAAAAAGSGRVTDALLLIPDEAAQQILHTLYRLFRLRLTCSWPSMNTPPGRMWCPAASAWPSPLSFPPWYACQAPPFWLQLTQMCCQLPRERFRGNCAT